MRACSRLGESLALGLLLCAASIAAAESQDLNALEVESSTLWEILDADPGTLVQIAAQAYMESDYESAAGYYAAALQANLSDAPIAMYNLACCYGLLGRPEDAGRAVLEAIRGGFTDLDLLNADRDFDLVRGDSIFEAFLAEATAELTEMQQEQSDESLGERSFLAFPSMQTMRIHLPGDYDPQGDYILVIALHGYGGDVTEFSARFSSFPEGNFIFACLQAPYAFSQGNRLVYSWTPHGTNQWEDSTIPLDAREVINSEAMRLSEELILAATLDLSSRYNVSEVVLMGFSQGGIMAYRTGIRNPRLFKCIATFSGILDEDMYEDTVLQEASSLPVFAGRGTAEDDRALNAVELLSDYGYDVTLYQWEGGHFIPDSALAAFEEWMMLL